VAPVNVLARIASDADAAAAAAMLVTWDRPVTWTGTELLAVVPLPGSPDALSPQAQTVPSERSADADPGGAMGED
jgi:hypothetical protein